MPDIHLGASAQATDVKLVGLTLPLAKTLSVARAVYDFATDGGAVSTITPANNYTIPNGAKMVGGVINVLGTATSGGSATIAVGTSAGSSGTSILAATGYASFTAGSSVAVAPTFGSPTTMSAAGKITVTIGTAALTGGTLEILVYYI